MSNNKPVVIAPSLLSADLWNLRDEVTSVEIAGADWHHVDVMDGHFVPNLTFGIPLIKTLKSHAKRPLDVHIMVSNPDAVAASYIEAGADILVFHVEAAQHAHRILQMVRSQNRKAGIALNPGTPLDHAFTLAPYLDVIMLMSVNPGFGGQSFIVETVERTKELRVFLDRNNLQHVMIEVDGGVNEHTAPSLIEAGATVLVAGTAVYGATDRKMAVAGLRGSST